MNLTPGKIMKLVYFDFGGVAEAIRLAFHLNNVTFEDIRWSASEFNTHKSQLPYQKLPVLVMTNGEIIPQSAAILRYVGRMGSRTNKRKSQLLYPVDDPLMALKCDALVDAVQDFNELMRPSMGQFIPDLDHDTMIERRKELATTLLPQWLEGVCYQLDSYNNIGAGGQFALGENMYICDLALFCRLKWLRKGILEGIPSTLVDDYPRLIQLMMAVQGVDAVQDYYETHPNEKIGWVSSSTTAQK